MKVAVRKIKKHWALIWLIVVMIAASVFITFAAYTGLKSVKRVVTTKSNPGVLFSSNCMTATTPVKRINAAQYTVTVCNYEQWNPLVANTEDIDYKITAEIKCFDNNAYWSVSELETRNPSLYADVVAKLGITWNYSIRKTVDDEGGPASADFPFNSGNNYKVTFNSQRLKAQTNSSTDKYQVTFDSKELADTTPDFYVYLTVEPTTEGYGDIDCYLCATQSTSDVAAWRGSFVESNYATTDYDFYNYVISGSGIGTLDIMWDPDWFELNKYFYDSALENGVVGGVTTTSNGWKKITLNVNSVTGKNRYELQLFKVKKDTSYTGSIDINDFISIKFTETSA